MVSTVAGALKAADDTKTMVEGQIVRKVDNERDEFNAATGTVKIDIDRKHLPTKGLEPNAKVRHNEVDVIKTGVEIEVKKVEVLGLSL
ncbi:MAG: NirD/YgiW/YdeI family stress tolerance protein [Betaproteobacteria bacterium]